MLKSLKSEGILRDEDLGRGSTTVDFQRVGKVGEKRDWLAT